MEAVAAQHQRRGIPAWLVLLLLAVGSGLVAVWAPLRDPSCSLHPDSARYLALGLRLRGGAYCNEDGSPHTFTPPVYPLVVCIASELAGEADCWTEEGSQPACPRTIRMVLLLQCAIFAASVLLLRSLLLALRVTKPTANVAAALLAISPNLLVYVGSVLSEVVFTFLLLAALLVLVRGRSAAASLAGGLLLGLAALTRWILVPWLIPLGLCACFAGRWRLRLALAALAFTVVLGAWCSYNRVRTGRWALTTSAATTIFEYAAPMVEPPAELERRLEAAREEDPPRGAFDEAHLRMRVGLSALLRHPLKAARAAATGYVRVVLPDLPALARGWLGCSHPGARPHGPGGVADELRPKHRYRVFELPGRAFTLARSVLRGSWGVVRLGLLLALALLDLCLTGCAAAGIWRIAGRAPRVVGWLVGTLLLVLAAGAFGVFHPRFRAPMAPAIAALAAAWVIDLAPRAKGVLPSRGARAGLP